MESTVLMVLVGATIIYAINNLVNLFKLDSQTAGGIGELLPTSAYVYTTLNYIFRIAFIYLAIRINPIEMTTSNVFWFVLVFVAVSSFLATLTEAILRTAILLVGSNKEEDDVE